MLTVVPVGEDRLQLRGELDLSTASILRVALANHRGGITLDLSGLNSLDSTGIHAMLGHVEDAASPSWPSHATS